MLLAVTVVRVKSQIEAPIRQTRLSQMAVMVINCCWCCRWRSRLKNDETGTARHDGASHNCSCQPSSMRRIVPNSNSGRTGASVNVHSRKMRRKRKKHWGTTHGRRINSSAIRCPLNNITVSGSGTSAAAAAAITTAVVWSLWWRW